MKINLQKMVIVMTSFLAVACIALSTASPAKAAIASYDPYDFLTEVSIDGDTKTVTFAFDDDIKLVNIWETSTAGTTTKTQVTESFGMFQPASDTLTMTIRTYPLGMQSFDNASAPSGGVLDISDIMPGAPITLDFAFSLSWAYVWGTNAPYDEDASVLLAKNNFGFFMYDSSGGYLGTEYWAGTTIDIINSTSSAVSFSSSYSWTLSKDVSYILPFLSLSLRNTDGSDTANIAHWRFGVGADAFTISTDINMVYENSQTMEAIKSEMSDISSGIQDTNDKLDDTNDKLDDIITGGEAGEEAKDKSDKLDQTTDILNDTMQDMDEAQEKLPTTPAVDELIDDALIDEAIADASEIFDWEESGLYKMFVPCGLSCSLSVLFYTIFGKKG